MSEGTEKTASKVIQRLGSYPSTKQTAAAWLGEVPSHWNIAPGHFCFHEKKELNFGLRETTVLSLSYGRIVVKRPENLHGLVPSSFETYQIVDPCEIVVRPTDLQNDRHSLRFALAQRRGIITAAYMCLRTSRCMTARYGHFLLHSYDLMKIFYGLGSGLRQNLNWRDFKYLPCCVPPLAEQAAIVRFLDYADRRIRQCIRAEEKLIELLEEQNRTGIHRAVTGQIDVGARRPFPVYKDSGIEWLREVPDHWQILRLKEVASVQTGFTLGKDHRNRKTMSRPYLRVANVQAGRTDLSSVKSVDVTPFEAEKATLLPGDVLMTEGGDIDKLGRGCLWRGEIPGCLHQNHVFAVRCNRPKLHPEFLVGLMASQHGRTYFQLTAKKTTNLASTNSKTLGAFPVLLPPEDEQARITGAMAEESKKLEETVAQIKRRVQLLREYRARLTADVVTGKLDVRESAASLPKVATLDMEAGQEELAGSLSTTHAPPDPGRISRPADP